MSQEREQVTINVERPTGPKISHAPSLGGLEPYRRNTALAAQKTAAAAVAVIRHKITVTLALTILATISTHIILSILLLQGAGFQVRTSSSYTGPGDINGTAHAFWSTRGVTSAFSGNVFRICDQATGAVCADATFASGVLTLPTLGGNACGVITCVVSTIYDQSGSSKCSGPCDVTQATNSLRPVLTLNCQNSKVCITFDGGSVTQCLLSGTSATQAQAVSFSAVFNHTALANRAMFALGNSVIFFGSAGANEYFIANNSFFNFAATDNTNHALQALFNGAGGSVYLDGTATTGQNLGSSGITAAAFGIGANNGCASDAWSGNFFEVGLWAGDKSANNASMNSNQHTGYWSF